MSRHSPVLMFCTVMGVSACGLISGLDALETGELASRGPDGASSSDAQVLIDARVGADGNGEADATSTMNDAGGADAARDAGIDAAPDAGGGKPCTKNDECTNGGNCVANVCTLPRSCAGVPPTCGANQDEVCCTSLRTPDVGNAGTFELMNGGNAGPNMASVTAFRLDKFEVSVGRFRRFLEGFDTFKPTVSPGIGKHPASPPGSWAGGPAGNRKTGWDPAWLSSMPMNAGVVRSELASAGSSFSPTPGANDVLPVTAVSWYEAFLFCIWDGGRLPTYPELMFAAMGGDEQRPFPWGTQPPSNMRAIYNTTGPAPVGSRGTSGVGRYGHQDLIGNAGEHMIDSFTGSAPDNPCTDCLIVLPPFNRSVFGYGFDEPMPRKVSGDLDINGSFIGNFFGMQPNQRIRSVGFRCARYSN